MDHIRIMLIWSELQPNATYVREELLDLADPVAIEREQWLLARIAERIGRHRRFMGFDLSNEIHWYAIPLGMTATPAQGDAWHTTLFETCEKVAPGKMHVSGIDRRMDPGHPTLRLPFHLRYCEFFIELMKAFHPDLDRKVWIEETGISTVWTDTPDFDPFMKLVDEGPRPAVVLQGRRTAPAYLVARGIDHVTPE